VVPGTVSVRLPRPFRTSSFRLTVRYAGMFAASVLVLFGIVLFSATSFIARQIDATVASELAEVQADAAGGGQAALRTVIDDLTVRSPGIFYLLQDAHGAVLAGNMEAIRPEPGLRRLRRDHQSAPKHAAGGIRGQGVLLPDGSYLFVGLSDFQLAEMQEAIARAFMWGLAATLLLAVGGGLVTSLALLRRVEAISDISRDIMRGDLGQRLPLRGTGDEFDHLSISLNAMLDRIQALMAGLQQVSSDIAHDLRTPLTRLRQRLELARRREAAVEGLQAAVDGAIEQTDAILDTFAALLRIAQIEAGTRKSGFSMVDLSGVLMELAEAYQVAAEEKGQVLKTRVAQDLRVRGDRELLMLLFANLIDNAVRHSPPDTEIVVQAEAASAQIRTAISDRGPGIPAELCTKVLQRFYRLEASRTTPGNGLGLSLVNAIAGLHEAALALEDNRPGLRCIVAFKRDPGTSTLVDMTSNQSKLDFGRSGCIASEIDQSVKLG
jgi:signal transduction histidine kinase